VQGQNVVGPGDVTGVNGGVDQEASAVLAAAYDAGLPILRRVHYPYLNAYTPSGFDAMVSYGAHGPDLVFRNTTNHPILIMTTSNSQGGTGVYIFNSAGYAPNHQNSAYTSTTSDPQVTLNQDGSVDTTVTRQITANGHTTHDRLTSHSVPIDP
jgi:vancomycin resistance protein YoaR